MKNRKRPRRRGNASLGLHLTAERSPPGKPASLGSLPRFCSSFLMALVLVCTGCALTTGYSEQRTTQSNERRCSPTPIDKQLRAVSLEEVDRAQSDPQVKAAQARLTTSFSWRAIQTARTIDILPLLSQIELTEESPTSDPSAPLKLLLLRQEALGRILLALIAVSITVAHVS